MRRLLIVFTIVLPVLTACAPEPREFHALALHELGHALCLPDSDDPLSIMNRSVPNGSRISAADAAAASSADGPDMCFDLSALERRWSENMRAAIAEWNAVLAVHRLSIDDRCASLVRFGTTPYNYDGYFAGGYDGDIIFNNLVHWY